jgi:hypothetical protein
MQETTTEALQLAISSLADAASPSLAARFFREQLPWLGPIRGAIDGRRLTMLVVERLQKLDKLPHGAATPLQIVRELAEPAGASRLGQVARELGRDLPRMNALGRAMFAVMDAPELVERALRGAPSAVARTDYLARTYESPFRGGSPQGLVRFQAEITERRGELVSTDVRQSKNTTRILIGRGALGQLSPDVVAFDSLTGRLSVHARGDIHAFYREIFGEVFFDDPDYLGPFPDLTLDPLLDRPRATLSAGGVDGLCEVRLHSAYVASRNHPYSENVISAGDVVRAIRRAVDGPWTLPRVLLELQDHSGACVPVLIGPGVLRYDRAQWEPVVRRYLEQRSLARFVA